MSSNEQNEKLMYQFYMRSKNYRRNLLIRSIVESLVIGSCFYPLMLVNLVIGIVVPLAFYTIAPLRILYGWGYSESYLITDTRLSIKGKEKHLSFSFAEVSNLKLVYAPFDKKDLVATIMFKAKNPKSKSTRKKTFKLAFVFNCQEAFDYLTTMVNEAQPPETAA